MTVFTRALSRMGALATPQDATPIRQASPADPKAPPVTGENMFTRAYDGFSVGAAWLEQLAVNDDSVLKREGIADLALYDALLDDDVAKTAFGQRTLKIVERPWKVEPGNPDDPRSVKAADDFRAMMAALGWDRITLRMLFGLWYGHAEGEGLYEVRQHDGRSVIWLTDIVVPDRKWFAFTNAGELRMRTPTDSNGVAVPPNKFWTYRAGASHDFAHYGTGLAHWCYWPIWFKRNVLQFWALYLEKFGQPTAVVPFAPGSPQDVIDAAVAVGKAIGTDSCVAVPASSNDPTGYDLKPYLIEANRGGSGAQSYKDFVGSMDDALRGVIMGQPGTSSRMATGLGSGQSDVQEGVADTQGRADSDGFHESFNATFPVWLTRWNHGEDVAPPTCYRNFDDEEDLDTIADRDTKLDALGWRRTDDSFAEVYGDGYERKPDPVTTGAARIDPKTGLPVNPIAANDNPADQRAAVFAAGDPRSLYISRRLVPSSARALLAWATEAGFVGLEAAGELHTTVCYSRTPVDWFDMPEDWSSDQDGGLTVKRGGPRAVEQFGEKAIVLMYASRDQKWRHEGLVEAGASHDWSEYRPHITFAKGDQTIDLAAVAPFDGVLKFGPEIWEPLDTDPLDAVALPAFSADQLDQVDALTAELAADLDPDVAAFGAAIAERVAAFQSNGGAMTTEGLRLALLQAVEKSPAVDAIARRLALPFAAERAATAIGAEDQIVGTGAIVFRAGKHHEADAPAKPARRTATGAAAKRFEEGEHPRAGDGKFKDKANGPDDTATKAKRLHEAGLTDANGKEKPLYHGTVHEFDKFDMAHGGKNTGAGYSGTDKAVYLTNSKTEAGHYAEVGVAKGVHEDNARVLTAKAAISNPLILDGKTRAGGPSKAEAKTIMDDDGAAIDYASRNGYDAVVWPNGNAVNSGHTVAVLDASKIKITNSGKGKAAPENVPATLSALQKVKSGDLYGGKDFDALTKAGYVNEDTGFPTAKGYAFLKKHE